MTYVEVAIAKQHTGNKFFSYETEELVAVGAIVRVPFGRNSALGIIMGIVKKPTFTTKQIKTVLPVTLPITNLELMRWMFNFYADDYGLITQLFIPSNFVGRPKKQIANVHQGLGKALPPATPEQKVALDILNQPNSKRVLLHGDTGTGKTRVFIEQANRVIASGKSVLLLTPEIGLTPQLISEVTSHTTAKVVLTHSALTPVERRRVWEHAHESNEPTIYIGPRSALFLPIKQLGLIVVDEAHDSSYKQLQSPRYQSMHIAAQIARLHDAQLVLSTATPNSDDYKNAETHGYRITRLTKPAAGDLPSQGQIIDITNRDLFVKNPYLSDPLLAAMTKALSHGEQIMLFLNRRGSARLVQCSHCGWQALCPRCGIPLTYHHDVHTIRCHSCNYKEQAPTSCPVCHSTDISFKSIGTKSLTEQVQSLFQGAKVMRFDADASAADQLHRHIDSLKTGEIDIVIGTQLISKGIDLPHLSVVGVINADSGLNLPDYRAEELTFQQLYQVTGRVGRGHTLSNYFIQTRLPNHPVIEASLQRSWEDYYQYELNKRQVFSYPPYRFLAIFKISRKNSQMAEKQAEKVAAELQTQAGITVLGPSPSFYEKQNNLYSWQIILKSHKRSLLVEAARSLPADWTFDIDPVTLL